MSTKDKIDRPHVGASSRRNFIAMTGMLAAAGAWASSATRLRAATDLANPNGKDAEMTSSVKHIVFMKFKDDISPARIEEHKAAVLALNEKVSFVRNIEFGADFSGRGDGLTHCIVVTFDNRSDVAAYGRHSEHDPVAEPLVADLERRLVMDVEFGV